jgi:uncharacterized damage-inducible protein DinB
MQSERQSTLQVIYENWKIYQDKLRNCILPLTAEQLALQPAKGMWHIQQLAQHIISVRAGWFSGTLQDADDAMTAYMEWGQYESPARTGEELARALDETWAFMESLMQRWTPEEYAQAFPDEWEGNIDYVSRSWVVYHVLEHDLHHGGEISSILGMNGLRAPNL